MPEELSGQQTVNVFLDEDLSVLLQIGEKLKEDYSSWVEANVLFDNDVIASLGGYDIPLAEYYAAKLILGTEELEAQLVWPEQKVIITGEDEPEELRKFAEQNGWRCFVIDSIDIDALADCLRN